MAGIKKSNGIKPKLKSKRSAMKRFKKTASGKIKHGSKGRRHGMSNKARKRTRQLRKAGLLTGGDQKLVSRLIPYL